MTYGKEQREEIKRHLAPYLKNKESTFDLRKCCEKCEKYEGDTHDFKQCNCPILELWYETKYWRWVASWMGCHDMNY